MARSSPNRLFSGISHCIETGDDITAGGRIEFILIRTFSDLSKSCFGYYSDNKD